MLGVLWIDAETYSEEPLDIGGMARYWEHFSTGVHCLGFAIGNGPVRMIRFVIDGKGGYECKDPELFVEFKRLVAAGYQVWAHKAEFEQEVLKRLGVPFKRSQIYCVMAQAAAAAFPLALEKLSMAVGLRAGKHAKGRAAMLKFCVPNPKTGKPWRYEDCPDEWEALYEYCAQDVVLERDNGARLPQLSDEEREIWVLDQEINRRGIGIDLPAAAGMLKVADSEMTRLDAEMREATGNLVPSAKDHHVALAKFLGLDSVSKDILDVALAKHRDQLDMRGQWTPAQFKAALIRQEAAKASVVKIRPMIQQSSDDSRYRWAKQMNAAGTGRWGGRGLQPDNLPAGALDWTPEQQELYLRWATHHPTGDDGGAFALNGLHHMDCIKESIRGLIVPAPGHEFTEVDFSAIETRLGAWVVGDYSVLDVFYGDGKIYERQAALMSGIPWEEITKKHHVRQDAKIWVLSAQYQAGAERLYNSACENARKAKRVLDMTFEDAERHTAMWREAHPAYPQMWRELEKAAKQAVKNPGERFTVHLYGGQPIVFCYRGWAGDDGCYLPILFCKLPSGRVLSYPFPELQEKEIEKGPMAGRMAEKLCYRVVDNKQWVWADTYGGKIFENVIQAIGACLLRHGMRMVNSAGIPIVTTCHDSLLTETLIGSVKPERIVQLMKTAPVWAETLPIECSYWVGLRYRKE